MNKKLECKNKRYNIISRTSEIDQDQFWTTLNI